MGGRQGAITGVTPLRAGVDALERGIARRSRRVYAPRWVGPVLVARGVAQRVVDQAVRSRVPAALEIARGERPPFTTEQP
jgi:hypothetical protein